MKRKEIKEVVKEYFEDVPKPIKTGLLLEKLNPIITCRCEQIKKEKKNSIQTVVFSMSCFIVMFAGLSLLFPEIIDFQDELVQFTTLCLTIGILTTSAFLIINILISKHSKINEGIKLRGNLL